MAEADRRRRGGSRPDEAGQSPRGPLPDDGHRDGVESAVQRKSRRHRSRGIHLHGRHAAGSAKTLPDAQLYFITGADALESILSWQDWEELFELANFVGVSRPGYELNASHLATHLRNLPADTLHLMEIPALAISSTDCRARAATGRPVWYLVPDGVVQYIAKRRLYRRPRVNSPGVSAPLASEADDEPTTSDTSTHRAETQRSKGRT